MAKENMRSCWMASFSIYNHKSQAGSQHLCRVLPEFPTHLLQRACFTGPRISNTFPTLLTHRWQFHRKHRSCQRISILPWTHPVGMCDREHCAFFPRHKAQIIPVPVWSQLHSFSPTQVKCSCCNPPLSYPQWDHSHKHTACSTYYLW